MAQIVIFAPPGEDVSAGEKALKDAGHDVEVVEATALNLLHMATGMMEGGEEEAPAEEKPVTEPTEEAPPAEEAPAEELPAEEPPVEESIGTVYVDGEKVPAYIDTTIKFPLLRVVNLEGDAKLSFNLNETTFSFWRDAGLQTSIKTEGYAPHSTHVKVGRTTGKSHIILDAATAKQIGLA